MPIYLILGTSSLFRSSALSALPFWVSDLPFWVSALSALPFWVSDLPFWVSALSALPFWVSDLPFWVSDLPIYLILGTSSLFRSSTLSTLPFRAVHPLLPSFFGSPPCPPFPFSVVHP